MTKDAIALGANMLIEKHRSKSPQMERKVKFVEALNQQHEMEDTVFL